jgi:hypothetical protein
MKRVKSRRGKPIKIRRELSVSLKKGKRKKVSGRNTEGTRNK